MATSFTADQVRQYLRNRFGTEPENVPKEQMVEVIEEYFGKGHSAVIKVHNGTQLELHLWIGDQHTNDTFTLKPGESFYWGLKGWKNWLFATHHWCTFSASDGRKGYFPVYGESIPCESNSFTIQHDRILFNGSSVGHWNN